MIDTDSAAAAWLFVHVGVVDDSSFSIEVFSRLPLARTYAAPTCLRLNLSSPQCQYRRSLDYSSNSSLQNR